MQYQPGMSLSDIAGQVTMGSGSSSEDDDFLDDDFNFGDSETDHYEQSSSAFSTPHSSTSLLINKPRSSASLQGTGNEPITGPSNESIILMLQRQQAMLQQVLDGQKIIEQRQDTVECQLSELQSKVEKPVSPSPSSSSSEGKRKRVVTRTLSVSWVHIIILHVCWHTLLYTK